MYNWSIDSQEAIGLCYRYGYEAEACWGQVIILGLFLE